MTVLNLLLLMLWQGLVIGVLRDKRCHEIMYNCDCVMNCTDYNIRVWIHQSPIGKSNALIKFVLYIAMTGYDFGPVTKLCPKGDNMGVKGAHIIISFCTISTCYDNQVCHSWLNHLYGLNCEPSPTYWYRTAGVHADWYPWLRICFLQADIVKMV